MIVRGRVVVSFTSVLVQKRWQSALTFRAEDLPLMLLL